MILWIGGVNPLTGGGYFSLWNKIQIQIPSFWGIFWQILLGAPNKYFADFTAGKSTPQRFSALDLAWSAVSLWITANRRPPGVDSLPRWILKLVVNFILFGLALLCILFRPAIIISQFNVSLPGKKLGSVGDYFFYKNYTSEIYSQFKKRGLPPPPHRNAEAQQ